MADVKAILRMDMTGLRQLLLQGWFWWTAELEGLLPRGLHGRFAGRPKLVAEVAHGRIAFYECRPGAAPAPRAGLPGTLTPRVTLALPATMVLLREIVLPAMPVSDIRRLVGLDLERLSPLRQADVVFDVDVRPGAADGQRIVTLGFVQRAALLEHMDLARKLGGEPAAASLVDGVTGASRFDFLQAERSSGAGASVGRHTYWWCAVLVLVMVNLGLLVGRDLFNLRALQEQVDLQQGSVTLAQAVRHRVDAESGRRRLLLTRHAGQAPLPVLDAVTKALPDGAYVQRLEWNGVTVHLVGMAAQGMDVASRLSASARFRNARSAVPASQGHGGPFDITVEWRGGGGA